MSTGFETLTFEHQAGVGRLTLRRPALGNAINLAMARDLRAVAHDCTASASVRVLVLSGAGQHFCLGGDLRESSTVAGSPAEYSREITRVLHEAMLGLLALPMPCVVALRGVAAGAGMGLALFGDLVIATRSARLVPAYTKVSLTPDAGVSFLLPRLVGRVRAMEMLLLNRDVSADEALQWGLVNAVVEDDALDRAVDERVAALQRGPAGAFAATKSLVRRSLEGVAEQMEAESLCMARQAATAEGAAGIAAFMAANRRRP
jgi:2-(1,2-epoxy-1,2-dihydrophenyl)acetyl-CoA isomerase